MTHVDEHPSRDRYHQEKRDVMPVRRRGTPSRQQRASARRVAQLEAPTVEETSQGIDPTGASGTEEGEQPHDTTQEVGEQEEDRSTQSSNSDENEEGETDEEETRIRVTRVFAPEGSSQRRSAPSPFEVLQEQSMREQEEAEAAYVTEQARIRAEMEAAAQRAAEQAAHEPTASYTGPGIQAETVLSNSDSEPEQKEESEERAN